MCVLLTGSERGEDPDQPLGHSVVPGCSSGAFWIGLWGWGGD